jgi:hypothetical protein
MQAYPPVRGHVDIGYEGHVQNRITTRHATGNG